MSVEVGPTIADGIAVNRPGDLNFSLIQRLVDEVVDVDEEAIAGAILSLLDKASILHIFHDRLNLENPIQVSRVKLNLETRGHDHAKEVVKKLREAGYHIKQTV